MLSRYPFAALVLACVVAELACPGCRGLSRSGPLGAVERAPRAPAPAGVAETVGEYAHLVGHDVMEAQGYGLVVGLGKAGSSEVPPTLRKYLTEQMLKWKVHSYREGTGALTPGRMLEDLDTAVVSVRGRIPAAAPAGTRFDLYVEALPGTQTVSLDGGMLMGTELRLVLGESFFRSSGQAKPWATGQGAVFVNPFVDPTKPESKASLRAGRVLDGGVVVRSRPVRLELRRADYRMSNLIQERINQRFSGAESPVATAKTSTVIDLSIPAQWEKDYMHFLRLLTHVHVQGGAGGQERYARRLAQEIELPTARYEDISLVWEAMGRQVFPAIRPLYASENPAAAFYSSRAGLRLGDVQAVEPMIYLAERTDSNFQIPAVGELGRAKRFAQGLGVLKRLVSSPNEVLRVAAYEALSDRGGGGVISRQDISKQFVLDVVNTDGEFAVYASSTGQPKVVLFGQNIPIYRPVFYCQGDDLVTINAIEAEDKVGVVRKVPRTGQMSETFQIDPKVDELVRVMGRLPHRGLDGKIEGLGLTYSQVVGVLHGLSAGRHVPAKFVLQRSEELRTIYSSTPSMGRPDMPEEDG